MDIDEENYFNTSDDEDDNAVIESSGIQVTEPSLEANDASASTSKNNFFSFKQKKES